MADNRTDGGSEFVIPARTLRGSREDMVSDIDQAIVGLLALRHLIDDSAPPPERLAAEDRTRGRHGFRWSRLFMPLHSAALWKLG